MNVLASNVPRIIEQLGVESTNGALDTSYNLKIVPLGSLRLKLVELLYQLLKLNKEPILSALLLSGESSSFLSKLSALLEKYPWNNFLQLKTVAVFEEIFESTYP